MSSTGRSDSRRDRLKRSAIPEPGPIRTLTKATLANTIGNGLYMTIEVIFFTRSVGLSNHQVALGLGLAAVFGLLVTIPAGHLADRRGPRELAAIFYVLEGVSMAAFCLVHSFSIFVVVAIAVSLFRSAGGSIRMTVMSRFGVGEERVHIRAFQRAVTNFGISIGMAFAGVALAFDTRDAYIAMVLGNALTFVIAAFYVMQLPPMPAITPPHAGKNGRTLVVLSDHRFLIASVLNGLFWIHFVIQSVGLPLWIIQHTNAPRWWISVLLIINTTMVIFLQVRFSKGTGEVQFAARTFRRSGLLIGIACLFYASAEGSTAVVASIVLVIGMLVHTLGELLSSSASWGIGFGMAREDLQGQYQGAYSMGRGLAGVLGPIIVIWTAITLGRTGWMILGAMFVTIGVLFPPLVRSYVVQRDRTTNDA